MTKLLVYIVGKKSHMLLYETNKYTKMSSVLYLPLLNHARENILWIHTKIYRLTSNVDDNSYYQSTSFRNIA